uniref:Uncharacterized protein n=1 Tax=Anguilla anguilla TaxID=7936 RepID=A0A0E9RB20_ANGAN
MRGRIDGLRPDGIRLSDWSIKDGTTHII